jgi:gluconate 2-dehydrogenase gamma chain
MDVMSGGHGAFFNDDDARTIAAFCERLMPGEGGRPGATNANVLNYIDLALSGAYADHQDFYRRGVAQLNAQCLKTYGKAFHGLTSTQQDETISALEHGKAPEFVSPTAQSFFETVRTHTMEGMFADPIYGGNKDFLGWQLVGFPGAQPLFTENDMHSKRAFTREPIVGLQARANSKTKG